MTDQEIQTQFIRQWFMLTMIYGEPQWGSSQWLDLWDDFLYQNWSHCRLKGVTVRQWLRAVRALDPEYIGAAWLVCPSRPRSWL